MTTDAAPTDISDISDLSDISRIVAAQRAHFATHATLPLAARRDALRRLYDSVRAHETDIADALAADLGKSPAESYTTETGLVLSEIRHLSRHLSSWARPHLVPTNLANSVATCRTLRVPYGVALVMSPWNYPVLLALEPLAGAIAAGNCCVVKPSTQSPATSEVIARICAECFDPAFVAVTSGGRDERDALLDERFDCIFFTGSAAVGRHVMAKAAENLTPVTLELGGKSPAIVCADANLEVAAARIAFGKYLNCGQTCVAPDYVLVDESVHDEFLSLLIAQIEKMYGSDPFVNPEWGRIVSERHFERISSLIDSSELAYGGRTSRETLQIEPTVLDGVSPDDAVMAEEIFGPVLPVLTYSTLDGAESFVTDRPTPLALYVFTSSRATERRFVRRVPFGGGCVNDTVVHLATPHLPFGGMGASGMGAYHGRRSFEAFTHEKGVMKKWVWPDLPMRYAPSRPWKQKLIRLFLR